MGRRGFSSFQLKMVMTIFMLIDHIAQFIPNTPTWFHYIGRLVAPIFFFLMVEGFHHTRNRVQYMKRLYIGAGIMFLGSRILDSILFVQGGRGIPNNIFLSLALGASMLHFIEVAETKEKKAEKRREQIKAVLMGFLSLFSEASFLGLGMILIFYFYRKDKRKLSIGYLLLASVFILSNQWMMAFALPFFFLYNGQRGRKVKYLFYVFYPLHIWILYIIGYYISLDTIYPSLSHAEEDFLLVLRQ